MFRSILWPRARTDWEGTSLSPTEWRTFVDGPIWKAFLYEIEDRENYLFQLFKDHDQMWNADTLRGMLRELDFVRQIPLLLIADIRDKENKKDKENEDGYTE